MVSTVYTQRDWVPAFPAIQSFLSKIEPPIVTRAVGLGALSGREKFNLLPLLQVETEGKGGDREEGMKATSAVTGSRAQ